MNLFLSTPIVWLFCQLCTQSFAIMDLEDEGFYTFSPRKLRKNKNVLPSAEPTISEEDQLIHEVLGGPPQTTMKTPAGKGSKTSKNSPCRCVPVNTCTAATPAPAIDIRITNEKLRRMFSIWANLLDRYQGMLAGCPYDQEWCCDMPGKPACGIRRVANASPQPPGTARFGEYPWHVGIFDLANKYLGSGVLIDNTHVLTVAHKVNSYPKDRIKVRLGDWDISVDNEKYHFHDFLPEAIFTHPDYNNNTIENSIAVIKISGKGITWNKDPHINPACPPITMPNPGTRCWVTGWGTSAFNDKSMYSQILKEINVPIVDSDHCEDQLRSTRLGDGFNLNKKSFICAGGEKGIDACQGDGGAPLVCQRNTGQWVVVGLVAWGIGCADAIPSVYINVLNYLPWIEEQIKK